MELGPLSVLQAHGRCSSWHSGLCKWAKARAGAAGCAGQAGCRGSSSRRRMGRGRLWLLRGAPGGWGLLWSPGTRGHRSPLSPRCKGSRGLHLARLPRPPEDPVLDDRVKRAETPSCSHDPEEGEGRRCQWAEPSEDLGWARLGSVTVGNSPSHHRLLLTLTPPPPFSNPLLLSDLTPLY